MVGNACCLMHTLLFTAVDADARFGFLSPICEAHPFADKNRMDIRCGARGIDVYRIEVYRCQVAAVVGLTDSGDKDLAREGRHSAQDLNVQRKRFAKT